MSGIKDMIKGNIRLYSHITAAKAGLLPSEREYHRFVGMISEIDPIFDIGSFKKAIAPILTKTTLYAATGYGAETRLYGYYDELLRYADRHRDGITLIPSFEHGIRFSSLQPKINVYSLSYACQGRNRTHEIHDTDPWKLVFSIGPYIHYARDIYEKKRYLDIKKKLGKTLLVFPSHTCEGEDKTTNDQNIVNRIMKKYSHRFDSILVCTYWKDISSDIVSRFEAEGAIIVSAGFRGDRNFVRRLKTIIRLADTVVVDDIGTNIGYCIYMGKPVYFEEAGSLLLDDAMYTENYRKFKEAFSTKDMSFDDSQLKRQAELYESFWGGSRELLTKEQASLMFMSLESICRKAHFSTSKMPIAERNFLKEQPQDSEALHIIRSALSPKLSL